MTLLARRREELAREREPQEKAAERRGAAVRPREPQPSFLHVQAALGNRATGGLLRSGAGVGGRDDLLAQELRPIVQLARLLHPSEEPQKICVEVSPTAPGFLVPDGSAPGAGQMTRSEFLTAMRDAARDAAELGLAGTGHTARGCPWIEHYFRLYQRQSAERIEADLLRYVPAARGAASAEELLAVAAGHVQASVRHWAATGELTGVPRGLPGAGLVTALAGSLAAVQAELGEGRPLDGAARFRMERAFSTRFPEVRLHTDSAADRLAGRFNARAFALGAHVAFGRNEYRPGTLMGDALLAHELAHVVQQRGATGDAALRSVPPASAPLERDADRSTLGVVTALWAGAGRLSRELAPSLRSGLSLQRCPKKKKVKSPADAKQAAPACPPPADAAAITKLKSGLKSSFKLSAVVEEPGSCWTKGELEKVRKGLDMVPKTQLPAIEGITLKRVERTTCEGSPLGCFQRRIDNATGERRDSIELSDEAFQGAAAKIPPVEDIVLHEVGHAVESVEFRAAESKRLKANIVVIAKNKERGKAVEAFNDAAPSSATGTLQISWDIAVEKKYGEGLLAANKKFTEISDVLKGIGDDPTSKALSDAVKKIEELANKAAKTIASIDKLRAAVIKKKPASTKLQPDVEKSFTDRLKAARAIVETSKAQMAAQQQFEERKKEEKKASAKIPVGDKEIDATRRLAELVVLIQLKGIDVKKSKVLKDYPKENWPQMPGELFADLFQMSVSEPKKLETFDADVAEFFKEPIGPKGKLKKQVDAKVEKMVGSAR